MKIKFIITINHFLRLYLNSNVPSYTCIAYFFDYSFYYFSDCLYYTYVTLQYTLLCNAVYSWRILDACLNRHLVTERDTYTHTYLKRRVTVRSRCSRSHLPHKNIPKEISKVSRSRDSIDRGIRAEFQISAERTRRIAREIKRTVYVHEREREGACERERQKVHDAVCHNLLSVI